MAELTSLTSLSVDQLLSLAEELRDLGVEEFSLGPFSVRFRKEAHLPAPPVTVEQRQAEPRPILKSIYDSPSLFPEGRPSFVPSPGVEMRSKA